MQWLSEDCRSCNREYEMIYTRAENLKEALNLIEEFPSYRLFSGGSDLSLKLQKDAIEGIIDISHLESLKRIKKEKNFIQIGALTTISNILEDKDIQKHLPLLSEVCKTFASHQIRNIATLAGNIVNDSPVADLIAPLLVLRTKVTLLSNKEERTLYLEELFDGYKSLKMRDEIITSFTVEIKESRFYYKKVGTRERLNITKLSLVVLKESGTFYMSGASLNPYVKRFYNLEKLLNSAIYCDEDIKKTLLKDIAPSSGSLSTAEYRKRVLFNMIKEALERLEE